MWKTPMKPATLLKVTLFHGCFSRFSKLCKWYQITQSITCLTNIICSSSSKRFLHKRVPVWITLYYILCMKTDTYWDITTDIFRLYSLKHQITFGLLQNSFKVVAVKNYMENIDLVRFLFCVIVLEKNMHYSFHRFYGR